jgi:NAD(P)-dependent dehydrogenase (short-subunit alcohol dehydrogenase family)
MKIRTEAAFITGGGAGIGRASAVAIAKSGLPVVVADIDLTGAEQTVEGIVGAGGQAMAVSIDVASEDSVENAFQAAESWCERITVLVNSAGILRIASFLDFPAELFKKVMDVNLVGTFLCAKRAAPKMIDYGFGRIINLSSVSGRRAGIGRTAYGTSKAAIAGLTRQMALELGPFGVTANTVAPGVTVTPMTDAVYTEETRRQLLGMIPAGSFASPEDIAAVIAFLASPEARYLNGEEIAVDGGLLASGVTTTGSLNLSRSK